MRSLRLILIVIPAICALLVAACGSSSRSGGRQAGFAAALRFSQCMRAHGMTNFPGPSSGGGIQIPNGVNPAAPAFQGAQKACAKDLPVVRSTVTRPRRKAADAPDG